MLDFCPILLIALKRSSYQLLIAAVSLSKGYYLGALLFNGRTAIAGLLLAFSCFL